MSRRQAIGKEECRQHILICGCDEDTGGRENAAMRQQRRGREWRLQWTAEAARQEKSRQACLCNARRAAWRVMSV